MTLTAVALTAITQTQNQKYPYENPVGAVYSLMK